MQIKKVNHMFCISVCIVCKPMLLHVTMHLKCIYVACGLYWVFIHLNVFCLCIACLQFHHVYLYMCHHGSFVCWVIHIHVLCLARYCIFFTNALLTDFF